MKHKYNLILSITSLVVVLLLSICVCYAWFIQVENVSATGINGVASDIAFTNVHLTRYVANETENSDGSTSYKKGEVLGSNTTILPFDILSTYTKVIYEITFETELTSYSLSMRNTKDRDNVISQKFKETDTSDTNYYNYLSNVANFYVLSKATGDSYTKSETRCSFTYSNSSDINRYDVPILTNQAVAPDANGQSSLCLLFDYNLENINRLFSANLGVDLGLSGMVLFIDDIQFMLKQ